MKKTKYVRVTEDIFDLKEDLENGKLYFIPQHSDTASAITDMNALMWHLPYNEVYRRVEEVVDLRSLVES